MTAALPRSPRARVDALTGLRFFAALLVVLFHVVPGHVTSLPAALANAVGSGYASVSLFFVLSGYILAYNYVPDPDRPAVEKRPFWVARIARIYPVYAFLLLLALPRFIHDSVQSMSGAGERLHDGVRVVALSLTMLQA